MLDIFNSIHYLWEPFFVDMVHHNYFMVTAGGRTSRAASKANYPFKLATAWNENKFFIYKQWVATKVLCSLCKKSILGNKLQNQSLAHTHTHTHTHKHRETLNTIQKESSRSRMLKINYRCNIKVHKTFLNCNYILYVACTCVVPETNEWTGI